MFDLTYFRVESSRPWVCSTVTSKQLVLVRMLQATAYRVVVHLGDREQSPIRLDVFRRRHRRSL